MKDLLTKKRLREADAVPPEEEENQRRRSRSCIHIPDDVLLDYILCGLPSKTLVRFQLVSRSWLSSIDCNLAPFFPSGFVYLAGGGKIGALATRCGPLIEFPDPCLGFHGHEFSLESSAHGLLCLRVVAGQDRFIYVCNPLTGDGKRIPWHDECADDLAVGLAFDPSTSLDSYKLVRPIQHCPNGLSFEIFSSRTGQWTRSTQKLKTESPRGSRKAFFAGGILYWYLGYCMVAFKPEEDAAEVVTVPQLGVRKSWQEIGVWDDCLTSTCASDDVAEVWVMVEKNRWEMIWRVDMEPVFDSYCRQSSDPRSLFRRSLPYEGGSGLYFRVQAPRQEPQRQPESPMMKQAILRLDLETNEVEMVSEGGDLESTYRHYPLFSYYNSLVPVPKTLQ